MIAPRVPAFALPGATKAILEELTERNDIDVLIISEGDGVFRLIGEPEAVQALLTEAKPLTNGIAAMYQTVELARASLMPA